MKRGGGALALFARSLDLMSGNREQVRRIDERHVRERLRKVSEHPACAAVVFL
jgi:hypothetical protein